MSQAIRNTGSRYTQGNIACRGGSSPPVSAPYSAYHPYPVPERIVSLSRPWLRPLVCGKAKAAIEFGAKPDIHVCDGWTRREETTCRCLAFAAFFAGGLVGKLALVQGA